MNLPVWLKNRSEGRLGKWSNCKAHSRNQPKGGHNSPKRYNSTCVFYNFISLHPHTDQKPLQRAKSAEFCTKLRLNCCVRLVCRYRIANLLSKNSFCSVQRVVSRPLRPIARMAPELLPDSLFSTLTASIVLNKLQNDWYDAFRSAGWLTLLTLALQML